MSKISPPSAAHALPYRSSVQRKTPPSALALPKTPGKGIYIASGIFIFALSAYTTSLYVTLTKPSTAQLPNYNEDVSSRYDTTASHYDADVSFYERVSGINRLRQRLVSQAQGDVLEVCVGTGRNSLYYDLSKIRSVAFVDQSAPMVEIAWKKWNALHPHCQKSAFHTQSMTAAPPHPNLPKEGYTTIIQTMGICSTSSPSAALAQLGRMAHPTEGKILLLEHGRGYYGWLNWILDRSAARHADRHGCWFNRDIAEVVENSGLLVERIERSQFGTVCLVEARPALRGEEDLEKNKEAREWEKRISSEKNNQGRVSLGRDALVGHKLE